jgi:hypothetical protein
MLFYVKIIKKLKKYMLIYVNIQTDGRTNTSKV